MKIHSIEVVKNCIPLKTPFKTALRATNSVDSMLVKLTTDTGLTGYGEAVSTAAITGETLESIGSAISHYIAPAVIGYEVDCLEDVMERLHTCIIKNTSAKAAVDMAIYDIYAQDAQKPLYKLLGGSKSELQTDITVSLNTPEEMIKDSIAAVKNGFNILKIKVGQANGTNDATTVTQIRKAVGDDIRLRIDANQGWTAKQAVRIIKTMEDSGIDIELVEQPVKAHDIKGMQYITKSVHTPILADESVFDAKQAIDIIQCGAADIINIKLMKCGGIYNALKIAAVAQIYSVECMMGCMLESHLAVSAAAHFAAGQSVVRYVDLDGPLLCKTNPFSGGPLFDTDRIIMQNTAGIGISEIPNCF